MNYWLALTISLSIGLSPVRADAPDTTTPAGKAKSEKPTSKKKPAQARQKSQPAKAELSLPVAPGPATVKQDNVNARGQAAINSEVVVRLKKGERVTVLEEVTLKKPKTDEPARWARIALPADAHVWVHSSYIDAATKTVVPKRLNVRSGPGENYSVLGRIPKGTVVTEVEAKGDWLKIAPPPDSYAFVAAHLLSAAPPAVVVAEPAPPPPPPPTETTVAVTPPPTPAVDATPAPPPLPTPEPAPVPAAPEPVPGPAQEEVLVKRIVTREGIVQRSVSIQAPTYYVLESLDNHKTINYLYSPSTNILVKNFLLKRIIVTGEESLDERWPNTPVLTVETLQAVP